MKCSFTIIVAIIPRSKFVFLVIRDRTFQPFQRQFFVPILFAHSLGPLLIDTTGTCNPLVRSRKKREKNHIQRSVIIKLASFVRKALKALPKCDSTVFSEIPSFSAICFCERDRKSVV